tara:strand:- start:132 stop:374 length:243 start_codon:yes stop_codon:yes gene_type:complete
MSHTQVSSESMDILEIGLQNRLDEYRDSHPNLVKLWKEYIKVKRISYLKSIVDCESMIENLINSRDISPDTIVMLYALFQ